MGFRQMFIEYLLVYCTSYGLSSLGEPSLHPIHQSPNDSYYCSRANRALNQTCKAPMPVWIISIFLLLGTTRWILTFLVRLLPTLPTPHSSHSPIPS